MDEPSPNFIVVYDLQSGTLFKKWKPSVNTVSLDISSKDGCVLSGLEDGRILVWDLITGKYINKLALNPQLTVIVYRTTDVNVYLVNSCLEAITSVVNRKL